MQTRTNQNVVYSSGGLSRYAAKSRERHLGSVITAHAVHAPPGGVDEEQMYRSRAEVA
ncbi:MAG: hypothetical protein WB660_03945 [Candidatus Sulfotelmatobacter sp.]